jgi:hypothetical protein
MALKFKIYFNSFLLIASSCVLLSCKSANSDVIYERCVVEKTQKTLVEGYGVKKDIFKLLEETEILLIENELIQNRSKESYINLNQIAFNNIEVSKTIVSIIEANIGIDFFDYLLLTTLEFYSFCPAVVYKSEKNKFRKNVLNRRFAIYSELLQVNFKNEDMINRLIKGSEEFSKTVRLVILHLILINLKE